MKNLGLFILTQWSVTVTAIPFFLLGPPQRCGFLCTEPHSFSSIWSLGLRTEAKAHVCPSLTLHFMWRGCGRSYCLSFTMRTGQKGPFYPLSHTHICFSDLFQYFLFFSAFYFFLSCSISFLFFFFPTLLTESGPCRSSWLAARSNKGSCTRVLTWDLVCWEVYQQLHTEMTLKPVYILCRMYPPERIFPLSSLNNHCWSFFSSVRHFLCTRTRTDFSQFTQQKKVLNKKLWSKKLGYLVPTGLAWAPPPPLMVCSRLAPVRHLLSHALSLMHNNPSRWDVKAPRCEILWKHKAVLLCWELRAGRMDVGAHTFLCMACPMRAGGSGQSMTSLPVGVCGRGFFVLYR